MGGRQDACRSCSHSADLRKKSTRFVQTKYLKFMFKHALQWGYIKNNPTDNLIRPKVEKSEVELLQPEELEMLIEHSEHPYKLAFLTAFLTGMQAGELWGLQWRDIYWNGRQIHVRRSLWNHHFQKPKTKNSIRRIDTTEKLVKELRLWKLACPVSEHDLMFPSPEGKATMHNNAMKRYFYPALRRSGLRQVSFHSLRHSNASLRMMSGQNIKYIQSQLGHSSINMTLDVYGHLFNDMDFNKKQVELLKSVRKPLENANQTKYARM